LPEQVVGTLTLATLVEVRQETPDTYTLYLALDDGRSPEDFKPGQFNMLYFYGVGEVPISVASSRNEKLLIHTIRSVGAVTSMVSRLHEGNVLGLRGPFGKPWPLEDAAGRQLLVIAGGLGLPPLRPVIEEALCQPDRFEGIKILYGARTPADLIYKDAYERWASSNGCEFFLTVDRGSGGWTGSVGVVTTLFKKSNIEPKKAVAFVCGPEQMIKFSVAELRKRGLSPQGISISMERNMSCGVGTCGHCQIGPLFICKDGPVFTYERIESHFKREGI
jgi:NAD(P)H-flavin reductase